MVSVLLNKNFCYIFLAFFALHVSFFCSGTEKALSNEEQFLCAAKRGEIEEVFRLLPLVDNVDTTDKKGATALHLASLLGHEAVVIMLLQAGANPNHKAKNDLTPVHAACIKGNASIAIGLVSYGARIPDPAPKMKNPQHQTTINSALHKWQTDLQKRQAEHHDAVFLLSNHIPKELVLLTAQLIDEDNLLTPIKNRYAKHNKP